MEKQRQEQQQQQLQQSVVNHGIHTNFILLNITVPVVTQQTPPKSGSAAQTNISPISPNKVVQKVSTLVDGRKRITPMLVSTYAPK